jgi:hypothetical protein
VELVDHHWLVCIATILKVARMLVETHAQTVLVQSLLVKANGVN